MAEGKRPALESFTTPRGVAVFPKLNTPDEYKGKRSYSTKLKLERAEMTALIEKIEAAADKAHADAVAELEAKIESAKGAEKGKAKVALSKLGRGDLPMKPDYDEEGNETEFVIMNFKMAASYTKGDKAIPMQPKIFDAKGKPLKNPPEIWGGSVLKVGGQLVPFYNPATNTTGVSLRLGGVQIIELRTRGGGGNAESYGFGKEEGYEAGDDASQSGFGDETGDAAGDTSDDQDF